MKILLVSRRYYPDVVGGGQISAHRIARALVDAGHDARVLTFRTDGIRTDETLDGVTITRMPIRTLRFFPRLSNLEWMFYEMGRVLNDYLVEFTPDVLHALNGESIPSVAWIGRRRKIPFVATLNGPTPFCFTQEGTDSLGQDCIGCKGWQRFRETMVRWGSKNPFATVKAFLFWLYSYPHMGLYAWGVRRASLLLPVSNGFKNKLIEMGYTDDKIRVIHNPMDVHKKERSTVKKRLNIPSRAKVLLFVGRLAENKGVQQMIKAAAELKNTHVVIVGKGEYEETLKKLAESLNVADRVHFIGFIPHDKVGEYYSTADVVIMAGTFFESLGRMLLEACSYGVPVIATDRAGNPDIIEHGKNGYLLKTFETNELVLRIKDIISSTVRAKKFGINAQKKIAEEFAPELIAKQLTEAYESGSSSTTK